MYKVKSFIKEDGYWSVELKRSQDRQTYWVDVSIDEKYHDVDAEWNQYIFSTINSIDIHRERVQDNCDEFDEATSEAICYLELIGEIGQDDKGNWFVKNK